MKEMKKLIRLIPFAFVVSAFLSCTGGDGDRHLSDSLANRYYDEATGYIERYVFSCPTDSDGNMISLNPDTEMLDSALIRINRIIAMDSTRVDAYLRKYDIFYLKQSYDSALSIIQDRKIRDVFAKGVHMIYPDIIMNSIRARMCEYTGDTIGRNQFLEDNVTALGQIVNGKEMTELLKGKENILHDMRYVILVRYFYFLNIINPKAACTELKKFTERYPNQEDVFSLARQNLSIPLFDPSLI